MPRNALSELRKTLMVDSNVLLCSSSNETLLTVYPEQWLYQKIDILEFAARCNALGRVSSSTDPVPT